MVVVISLERHYGGSDLAKSYAVAPAVAGKMEARTSARDVEPRGVKAGVTQQAADGQLFTDGKHAVFSHYAECAQPA